MKDFHIFEDYKNKSSTELSNYSKGTPTFQGFFLIDNDNEILKDNLHSTRASRNTLDTEKTKQSPPPCNKSQKINNIETFLLIVNFFSRGQKLDNVKSHAIDVIKTQIDHIFKLFTKAKDVKKDSLY